MGKKSNYIWIHWGNYTLANYNYFFIDVLSMTCFKNKNSVKPDETTPAHKQKKRRDRDSGAGNTDACNSSNNNRRGWKSNGRLFSTTLF